MNSFPHKWGLNHYPPSTIMTGAQLHMSWLQLKFGSYCQIAEDVTPCNSLATHTRGAISMGPSGNFSGGQRFISLNTGKLIVGIHWKELPMSLAVINQVNMLGFCWTFTIGVHWLPWLSYWRLHTQCWWSWWWWWQQIYCKWFVFTCAASVFHASRSVINQIRQRWYDPRSVFTCNCWCSFQAHKSGYGWSSSWPPQVDALFDDAVFDTVSDDGLETYELNEPFDKPEAASP